MCDVPKRRDRLHRTPDVTSRPRSGLAQPAPLGASLAHSPNPDATLGPLRALRTMICSKAEVGLIMDVVVWLRSLGLGKYEAIFRENDIDETVLPSLTHENLKELGVQCD